MTKQSVMPFSSVAGRAEHDMISTAMYCTPGLSRNGAPNCRYLGMISILMVPLQSPHGSIFFTCRHTTSHSGSQGPCELGTVSNLPS